MKAAFIIALSVGAASGTQIRSEDSKVATQLDVSDNSFIEALASKYDCREAGTSLEDTIKKVKVKNAQELTKLGVECTKRRTDYNGAWTKAQETYSLELPKIVPEEEARYTESEKKAQTEFKNVETTQANLVATARTNLANSQADYDSKKAVYDTKFSEHASAAQSAAAQEKEYNEVTRPREQKKNMEVFTKAKNLLDGELAARIKKANEARAAANKVCESITAARKKHVDADNNIIANEIGPLVKELSALKCVDSYEKQRAASGLDKKKAAFVELSAEDQAACALGHSKLEALIETSNFLGGLPLDSQFKVFTDRVAAERTHMEKVHNKCIAVATSSFNSEKTSSEKIHSTKSAENLDTRVKADAVLDKTYDNLVSTNKKIVAAKAEAMVVPLSAKNAAAKVLDSSKTTLASSLETERSEVAVARDLLKKSLETAVSTKKKNIASRQSTLDTIKSTAFKTFEQDKKFVEEYCKNSETDLMKEKSIVLKIESKLTRLVTVDTAQVGTYDAEAKKMKAIDTEEAAKKAAEEAAKKAAEEAAKKAAEEAAKKAAEQAAKKAAEEAAKKEQAAKRVAEQQAKHRAEQHAKHVAEQQAKHRAEQHAKHVARVRAEQHAKHVARVRAEQHHKHVIRSQRRRRRRRSRRRRRRGRRRRRRRRRRL
jgi:hypothetical protein